MTKKMSKANKAKLPAVLGRPTLYSDELASTICAKIADGKSLRGICREKNMPSTTTVIRWLTEKPLFQALYTRARELQADAFFDDVIAIADDLEGATHEEIQAARVQVDVRKWAAGKLRPRKYSEKFMVEGIDKPKDNDALSDIPTAELEALVLKRRADEAKQIN